MKITVEIPYYSESSGGILKHIKLVEELRKKHTVHLRIQKIKSNLESDNFKFDFPYSVGLPDKTFPSSDIVITYSDNPYTEELLKLTQVKKVLIYMLSYGMCIERERKNVLLKNITVMSSTIRTQKLIELEGVKCCNVGFGYETKNFFIDSKIKRNNYAVILYHHSLDKRYSMGVEICEKLLDEKLIDGVITFGRKNDYKKFKHPSKLIEHFFDATPEKIREIFNLSKVFIMPSITEGLNLTPIESTLCGCPSVICDGAINEIYFNGKTCFVSEKDNFEELYYNSKELLDYKIYSNIFYNNIKSIIKNYTWDNTISKIEKLF